MSTVREILNVANPNNLPSALQTAKVGDALTLVNAFARGAIVANVFALPNARKAIKILSIVALSGGVTGYLILDAGDAVPAAGHASITSSGDIQVAAADAITAVEVTYVVCEGELITETIPAAASVGTFLAAKAARLLISAQIVTGVTPGTQEVIDVRTTAAPAAGHAALNALGTGVVFNAANVVAGTVLVTYIAAPGVGAAGPALDTRLETTF